MTGRKRQPERRRSTLHIGTTELRDYGVSDLEVRTSKKSDTIEIAGSPICYDTPYSVQDRYGTFVETMRYGVVTDLLKRGNLRTALLINHDTRGLPLARYPHTLQLKDTPGALTFTAQLDGRMQLARDLSYSISRRDLSQMSIGFLCADGGDRWSSDESEREVFRFSALEDISCVTYPASPTTNVEVQQRLAKLTQLATQPPTHYSTDMLKVELEMMRFGSMRRQIERLRATEAARTRPERSFAVLRAVASESRLKVAVDLDNSIDNHATEMQSVMSALIAAGHVVDVVSGTKGGKTGTTTSEKSGYLAALGVTKSCYDDLIVLPDAGNMAQEKAAFLVKNKFDVLVDNDAGNCAAAAAAGVPLVLSPYGAGEPAGSVARIGAQLAELRADAARSYLAAVRAKYTQAEVDALGKQGHALKDDIGEHFSYPVHDLSDLKRAIKAIGRGGADHDKIRRYVIGRARVMGQLALIPPTWDLTDGSLKAK